MKYGMKYLAPEALRGAALWNERNCLLVGTIWNHCSTTPTCILAILYISNAHHRFTVEIFLLIRLLEESSLFLKQKQDNLAAQLQVAQEHKSRLQNQVDQSVKSIKTAKDQFETYR